MTLVERYRPKICDCCGTDLMGHVEAMICGDNPRLWKELVDLGMEWWSR